MANLIDLDLLSRFKTNADSTYLIKHLASGTLAAQTIEGDVNIGTDTNKRNLTVSGDLYVKGTEYIVDVETLNSSSDLIVINANNDTLVSNTGLVTLTGGTATYPQASPQPTSSTYKKNVYYKYSGGAYVLATSSFESGVTYYVKSSPAYALTAYDPIQDVIQLGSGTYKSTGEFTFGTSQAQAIATRESSIEDRSILIWDGGTHQIRDSYTLISDLQPSSTVLTSLAGVSTSSTGLLKITNGSVSIDTTSYVTSSTDQTISGSKTFSSGLKTNSGVEIKQGGESTYTHLSAMGSGTARNINFPDKDGTVALTSDIPTVPTNYITTNSNQTGLTGNKTTTGGWTFSYAAVHGTGGITVKNASDTARVTIASGPIAGNPTIKVADSTTGSVTYQTEIDYGTVIFGINSNDNSKYKRVNLRVAALSDSSITNSINTVTLPYLTGTVILDAGTQTISGDKTFIGTTTIGDGTNGSLVVNSGSTFYADSNWLDGDSAPWGTRIGGSQGAQRILSYDWREDQQTYQTEIEPGYVELSQLSTNNNYSKSVKLKIQNTASISSNDSYTLTVPLKTGTLATTSDLPTNYVTTDTAQTITAGKTFEGSGAVFYNGAYGPLHYINISATSTTSDPYIEAGSITLPDQNLTQMNYGGIKFIKKTVIASAPYAQTVALQMDQSTFSSNADYTLTLPKRTDTIATLSDLALATNAQIDALFGISA